MISCFYFPFIDVRRLSFPGPEPHYPAGPQHNDRHPYLHRTGSGHHPHHPPPPRSHPQRPPHQHDAADDRRRPAKPHAGDAPHPKNTLLQVTCNKPASATGPEQHPDRQVDGGGASPRQHKAHHIRQEGTGLHRRVKRPQINDKQRESREKGHVIEPVRLDDLIPIRIHRGA